MESLDSARQLRDAGRYREALKALDAPGATQTRTACAVLKAELLECLGQNSQAHRLAEAALQSKDLSVADRASCECVIGKALLEQGDVDSALEHLQRSASMAHHSNDSRQLCWSQLALLVLVADRSGPDAARPLLADLRRTATKLGDPRATVALHLHVGELEAKRGLFDNALRHIAIGRRLLQSAPNLWLEAFAENALLGIGILRSEFQTAHRHGQRAVDLAERSGVAIVWRACLGNLGNLYYATGEFERAVEFLERAGRTLPATGDKMNAGLDSLAQILLAQNRADECAAFLDRIDMSIRSPKDRILYGNRAAALTRADLLARVGRTSDALVQVEFVLDLGRRAGDTYLSLVALLTQAELLQQTGRASEAVAILNSAIPDLAGQSPALYAHGERILAGALVAEGRPGAASAHYQRARRIYAALRSVPEELELERCWSEATARRAALESAGTANAPSETHPRGNERSVLHSAALVMLYPNRPELVAREVVELLSATQCVQSAAVISRGPDGSETMVLQVGEADGNKGDASARRLAVGFAHGHAIEIIVQAKTDTESAATVNAVTLLLSTVHDLERARVEREERATLWPVEELPIDGQHAVISGHMREQMNFAQRIARTNVNVLITGESGTGKEILARAVHTFSERADMPFVPFNCTAIPRDLLESQLFGHRRGAFTGADRDQAGLIRAAREGTLFLDEIGALGLDLQPKLLRFLESGEIAPLGEPGPLTVNVRIVAATNGNLEDAVRAGKFREDLFYRLNVVRLTLRPLRERRDEIPGLVHHFVARAAEEFRKGHVRVAEETMERLLLYRWPGNVRQLQNELRRMVALAEPDSTLAPDAISADILGALPLVPAVSGQEILVPLRDKLLPTLARIELEMIKAALRDHHGKVDAVAKALGISRKGLYLKRQRLGL